MITILIVILIILLGLFAYYVYTESTGYKVTEYSICSDKIKKDKVKIAFLSDLHNTEHGSENSELYKSIQEFDPDVIMFAGDMVTSCKGKNCSYENTLKFIQRLSAKWPVYYGIGNHEERFRRYPDVFPGVYEDLINKTNAISAPIIINEVKELDELGIKVYGLDLDHFYYRKVITRKLPEGYLNNIFGNVDSESFSVLIAHNPEHFKSYCEWGPDLVLSGHVHGGIIRLPLLGGVISPALKIFPRYDGGEFISGKTRMILSRGAGNHTVPIRINNKAELIFITVAR